MYLRADMPIYVVGTGEAGGISPIVYYACWPGHTTSCLNSGIEMGGCQA